MIYLEHQGSRIATFEVIESDQPWLRCTFTPSIEFREHEKFFKDFQDAYQNKEYEDLDDHFSKLTDRGYRLVSGRRESVRFTLILERQQARLRAHFA